MKTLITVTMVLILTACGKEESKGSPGGCYGGALNGTYSGSVAGNPDTMEITDSCSVTSSYCGSTTTIPKLVAETGYVKVSVSASPGKYGCLPVGDTTCAYDLTNGVLKYTCGSSVLTYTKQ